MRVKKTPILLLYPPAARDQRRRIGASALEDDGSMSEEGTKKKRYRPDQDGKHEVAFKRNKKKIFASQNVCGICGQPVDMSLKYPHPLSPCIDHITPLDRGGHPSDINNLQLAHWKCNRLKANKILFPVIEANPDALKSGEVVNNSNRNLPLAMDWSAYRPADGNDRTAE